MKNIVFILIFCVGRLVAQEKPVAEFDQTNHDFGTIKEQDGPVIFDFTFTNTGNQPLIISKVKPSCGCTTPNWSKEPVLPGEKGVVTAQYNPRNRPGAFRKSLTVTTNAEESILRLYINGKVIPAPKTIEEEYSVKLGAIRIKNKTINFGRVTTEKAKEKVITVYNDSDEVLTFNETITGPDFISVKFDPVALNARSKGNLIISYNPDHEDNLGFNSHSINIHTDETSDQKKELHIVASITEYFPPLSDEEKEKSPKLNIEERVFDFGKMKQENAYETEFTIRNTGKSNLNIRKIKSNCGCLIPMLNKYNIKPGKSAKLKMKFNAEGKRGNQIKNVTIYSNDPLDPTQMVTVKGNVIVD